MRRPSWKTYGVYSTVTGVQFKKIVELDLAAETSIPARRGDGNSPIISVVVPTYEPNGYFAEALQSVLRQDLGPQAMQIAVVDDASSCDIEALVAAVDPARRIEIYRSPRNQGLSGNWNQCIRVARGRIVHILHQDDWIAEGFYQRMLPAFTEHEEIGMAFCRYAIAKNRSEIDRYSHREKLRAGVLANWLQRISERQRIQCAAVLVRRAVYEALGGYRSDLCYALDWEMWVRIAARYPVWFEPRKLAYYRRHAQSETNRLIGSDTTTEDTLKAIRIIADHLPSTEREKLVSAACVSFARRRLKQLTKLKPDSYGKMGELLNPVMNALDRVTYSQATLRQLRGEVARLERAARS